VDSPRLPADRSPPRHREWNNVPVAGLSVSVSTAASVEGPFTVVSLAGEADASCRELEAAFAALASPQAAVARVLELTGADRVFPVYHSVQEAVGG
jgi:hypothetical protein